MTDIRIRGIYATALTRLFADNGYGIVSPSGPIVERFNALRLVPPSEEMVEVRDLENRQGVLLEGEAVSAQSAEELMRSAFPDAVFRKGRVRSLVVLEVEFPFDSKRKLDELRSRVVATVPNHHRLRIIASEYLDQVEGKELARQPEREEMVKTMASAFIGQGYKSGKPLSIDHVKVDGRVISLSGGKIVDWQPREKRLLLKRGPFRGGGLYDGLGLAIEDGDYALTTAEEGSWICKHTYYRRKGETIGEYYNINTPVELYPDRIRYIDLEIDVVRLPYGIPAIVDEEKLNSIFSSGFISDRLNDSAKDVASELIRSLSRRD